MFSTTAVDRLLFCSFSCPTSLVDSGGEPVRDFSDFFKINYIQKVSLTLADKVIN
jgi:hypothetical protein